MSVANDERSDKALIEDLGDVEPQMVSAPATASVREYSMRYRRQLGFLGSYFNLHVSKLTSGKFIIIYISRDPASRYWHAAVRNH